VPYKYDLTKRYYVGVSQCGEEETIKTLPQKYDRLKGIMLACYSVEKEKQTLVVELDGLSGQLDSVTKAKVTSARVHALGTFNLNNRVVKLP
jgi:hypothetical protein